MKVFDAIRQRRSIRRFSVQPVPTEALEQLSMVAECYPCPANLQPLRFWVVNRPEDCQRVFSCLKWAGLLRDFTIEQPHQPKAYFVIAGDRSVSTDVQFSAGAAATELMLGAQALGLASCCLTPADKPQLYKALSLDADRYDIVCVVALGYSEQTSTAVPADESVRYYLAEDGTLCVPKRPAKQTVTYFTHDGE